MTYKQNEILINNDYAVLICKSKTYGIFESKIDIEDIPKIQKYYWHIRYDRRHPKHYIESKSTGKRVHLHRYLLDLESFSIDKVVDHINGDSLDNRKSNLRICTLRENCQNQKEKCLRKTSKSGVNGIYWIQQHKRWRITYKGKYLGQTKTLEEAKEKLNSFLAA